MSRRPPTLAEIQGWLRWIFTEPRHAADALAAPEGEPAPRALPWIADRGDPPSGRVPRPVRGLSRESALDVYRESYFARLIEALGKDFPAVKRVVGEANFEALVGRYLGEHPSRSPNIGDVGHAFAGFLAASDLSPDLPFLPDLARLEWSVIEAFHAGTTPPLDPVALQAIDVGAWPRARIRLAPSVRILPTEWPVADLWRFHDSDEIYSVGISREPRAVLVHRDHGGISSRIRVTPLGERQAAMLSGMKQGVALAELLAASESAEELTRWFSEWASSGVIASVEIPG